MDKYETDSSIKLSSNMVIFNRSECKGNHSATLNNMKLVHRPLMGGLLHLVQR